MAAKPANPRTSRTPTGRTHPTWSDADPAAFRARTAVELLCRVTGQPDLATWLDLGDGYTPEDAIKALEKKRRQLERDMADPAVAREAELVFNHWADLRAGLVAPPEARRPSKAGRHVDHYAVLGVQPTASFLAIERAYRALLKDRPDDRRIQSAWHHLGDPGRRAQFDRDRRLGAVRTVPDSLRNETTHHDVEKSVSGRVVAELPGPEVRDVHLEGDGPTVRSIPVLVRGNGVWRAQLDVDHPCLTTTPEASVRMADGRHSIAVRFDPAFLTRAVTSCSVTLTAARETHVVTFRVHKAPARRIPWKEAVLALGALSLLGVGWFLGQQTTVRAPDRLPASEGRLSQIATVSDCFDPASGPTPAWVDIHVDGLGRPTGFHAEGPTPPRADACVRDALRRLEFPPTANGLPAFHRYRHVPPEVTP